MTPPSAFVRSTVAALLLDDQRHILLTYRLRPPFYKHWTTPGGHIDAGETAYDAVIRETQEETGLVLHEPRYLGYWDERFPHEQWWAVVHIFTGRWTGELQIGEGEGEARFFTFDEALQLPLAFDDQEILQRFRALL